MSAHADHSPGDAEHLSAHTHHHSELPAETTPGRIAAVIALNLGITATQIAGGLISGSLALLSDALHNLSDALAIFITWISLRLSQRPVSGRYTFGWKRAEILAALFNAAALILIAIYLFAEALNRFFRPEPISGFYMVTIALIGLAGNLASIRLLHGGHRNSLNIRAAYLHLLGDAVSSIAVLAGGLAIVLWNLLWIDPFLTILIGLYLLKGGYDIIRESAHILMMGSPQHISAEDISARLCAVQGVTGIHHVHLWSLNDRQTHFEAHVSVEDQLVSRTRPISHKINEILQTEFHIGHITLQFEDSDCRLICMEQDKKEDYSSFRTAELEES